MGIGYTILIALAVFGVVLGVVTLLISSTSETREDKTTGSSLTTSATKCSTISD